MSEPRASAPSTTAVTAKVLSSSSSRSLSSNANANANANANTNTNANANANNMLPSTSLPRGSAARVARDGRDGDVTTTAGLPSAHYVFQLWHFVAAERKEQRDLFLSWPLLPLLDGAQRRELATVDQFPQLVVLPPANRFPDRSLLLTALTELRVPLLDTSFFPETSVLELSGGGVGGANYSESLPRAVLLSVHRLSPHRLSKTKAIDASNAAFLCRFFANGFASGGAPFDAEQRAAVRRLPIFELAQLAQLVGSAAAPSPAASSAPNSVSFFRVEQREREKESKNEEKTPTPSVSVCSYHSLSDSPQAFMVPPDVGFPPAFSQFLVEQRCFFAFKYPEFYRFVGVVQLKKSEVLETYLASAMGVLSPTAREELMTHIRDCWAQIDSPSLRGILGGTPFIRAQTGMRFSTHLARLSVLQQQPRVSVSALTSVSATPLPSSASLALSALPIASTTNLVATSSPSAVCECGDPSHASSPTAPLLSPKALFDPRYCCPDLCVCCCVVFSFSPPPTHPPHPPAHCFLFCPHSTCSCSEDGVLCVTCFCLHVWCV